MLILARGIAGAAAAAALAAGLLASRHESVPVADVIFRHDPGAASAMIRNALRPACLASCAFAIAIDHVVLREELFEKSFNRLTARFRR